MANDINRLLDMLCEKIEEAPPVPFQRNSVKIDREEMLDLLDDLRAQIPAEVKRANDVLSAREKHLEDAKREADRILRQAENEAKTKVSNSEIVYAAKDEARRIVAEAEERSRQIYQMVNEYTDNALTRAEEAMQKTLEDVRQRHSQFRTVSNAQIQDQQRKMSEKASAKTDKS